LFIVRLTPFNFSDGINSAEAADFAYRQGGSFGQTHLTREQGCDYECTLYLIPANDSAADKIRDNLATYQALGDSHAYATLITNYWVSDWRAPLVRGMPTKVSPIESEWFNRGALALADVPCGRYFMLPILQFKGQPYFSHGYLWTAAAFRDEEQGPNGTQTPVTWCPNEFSIQPGETTYVSLAPHAFNMNMEVGIKKFLRDVVFSEFPKRRTKESHHE
jgi:hypothetical protein